MDRLVGNDPDIVETVTRRIPLQRYGQKSEIADASVFLFSPAASYITGAVLVVDGGDVSCDRIILSPSLLLYAACLGVDFNVERSHSTDESFPFRTLQYHMKSQGALMPYPEIVMQGGDTRALIASKL